MKKLSFLLMILVSLFSFSASFSADKGVIIPAYFYDSSIWDRLIDAKSDDVDFVVIVNPNSGPGDFVDPHYTEIIDRLNANRIKGVGYVHTSWGNRPLSDVKDEIDRWIDFYPGIKGFFLDEASADASDVDYYAQIYTYIKSKGNYYVVLNPGTKPSIDYYSVSDLIVVYESPYGGYQQCNPDIPEKSGCIFYSASETEMEDIVKNVKSKYVYITDDGGSNPYDTLPTYFEREVKLLANQENTGDIRGIIFPAYFYDGNLWERILSQNIQNKNAIAIVNPASGPGYRRDWHYYNIINRLVNKGVKPVGYVYTSYGHRPLWRVKRDIRKWLKLYPDIKGIFLDQVSTSKRKFRYYKKLYRFIKRKGLLVILSPGTDTYRRMYKIADFVITYVGNVGDFEHCSNKKPFKSGCIVYGASYDDMVNIMESEKAGLIYITDDRDYNPFDTLPSYLEEEIEYIK